MPLRIPAVTAEDVWEYTVRKLTNLADARAELIDALATPSDFMADVSGLAPAGEYDTEMGRITGPVLTLAHFDIAEFEKAQAPAAENAAVEVSVTTADQSLGSKDITVDIPAGATIISVLAVAKINIMNNAATAQKIDLKFEVESVALFNQSDVVGFGAIDGASAVFLIAENASDEVTADEQVVTLEAKATLSAAASVRFQAQYYLFIAYKMG